MPSSETEPGWHIFLRTDPEAVAESVTESALYPEIIGAYSHGPTRIFRQLSLLAWGGKIIRRTTDTITLAHPHAIKVGAPGISDLGGFTAVKITADMVGQTLAVAIEIEVKGARTPTLPEQIAFLEMARARGCRAGIARSVEDAGAIIHGLPHI
jgi:hypothetical protein